MRPSSALLILGFVLTIMAVCGNKNDVENMPLSSELIKQGDDLFSKKDKSEALEIYKVAADTALAEKNNSNLTEAYAQVARCYLSMDKKEEGRPWLDKAEQVASDSEPYG